MIQHWQWWMSQWWRMWLHRKAGWQDPVSFDLISILLLASLMYGVCLLKLNPVVANVWTLLAMTKISTERNLVVSGEQCTCFGFFSVQNDSLWRHLTDGMNGIVFICTGALALKLLVGLGNSSSQTDSPLSQITQTQPVKSSPDMQEPTQPISNPVNRSSMLTPSSSQQSADAGHPEADLSEADWQRIADTSWSSTSGRVSTSSQSQSSVHGSSQLSQKPSFSRPSFTPLTGSSPQPLSSCPATAPVVSSLQEQLIERSMLLADSDDDEPLQEMEKLEKEESILMSQAFWGEEEEGKEEIPKWENDSHFFLGGGGGGG